MRKSIKHTDLVRNILWIDLFVSETYQPNQFSIIVKNVGKVLYKSKQGQGYISSLQTSRANSRTILAYMTVHNV